MTSRIAVLLMALGAAMTLAASCAPRVVRPTAARLAELARADALVLDGCYRCLRDARDIYAVGAGAGAPRKEFDTTVLLAARAKELGLASESESELTRARELAKKLQTADGLSARIDAVEAITGELAGLDSEERHQRDERLADDAAADAAAARRMRVREALAPTAATDITSAYLVLALDCERPGRRVAASSVPVPGRARASGPASGSSGSGSGPTPASGPSGSASGPTPASGSSGSASGPTPASGSSGSASGPTPASGSSGSASGPTPVSGPAGPASGPPTVSGPAGPASGPPTVSTPAAALAPGAALWRYRVALCGADFAALKMLREQDPRWAESFYFEGKDAMGSPARSAEPARAATLLTSAVQTFQDSIPAYLMLGNAYEMEGDAAASLAAFDRVLAIAPAHLDARIGRVRTLSYLGRTDEGIAAATALIDLGSWHVGDAYYWRAWNQYQARRLELAWADVQQAMSLLSNTAVHALAGSIAYARKDLDVAVRHFTRAFEIDPSNCLAIGSAGLVRAEQRTWPSAVGDQVKATRCFAQAEAAARADLEKLAAASLEPAVKASRLASTQKRRESAEALGAQAAIQAAESFIQMGDTAQASTYIDLAARHPGAAAKAAALKARITGTP